MAQQAMRAAAQGLVAGVNASLLAAGGDADFVHDRADAYIGVMIDDLTTKGAPEPYGDVHITRRIQAVAARG